MTVAELVPEIIEWARGPMAAMTGDCLDDKRLFVDIADVGVLIGEARGYYDAILLDVDNGPDGLTRTANNALYSRKGLAAAKAALKPGGILAIWSAAQDEKFKKSLGDAGFAVDEVAVRARENGKGAKHIIWFATEALDQFPRVHDPRGVERGLDRAEVRPRAPDRGGRVRRASSGRCRARR